MVILNIIRIKYVFKSFYIVDYVKVATFFKGSRRIEIEELAPSENVIAISSEDEKTFYLNAN